jgi:hypothetical protein
MPGTCYGYDTWKPSKVAKIPTLIVLRKLSWLGHMTAELDISENQFGLSLACGSQHIGLAQLST